MRISLFQAFASNNSGSYTIVGTFRDEATAESVARVLAEVTAAHDAWHREHTWSDEGSSPLDELVEKHGLRAHKPGRGDQWPEYGEAPSVLASGHQVVVHAPYTVSMPAVYGEFFYAMGGRVQVELDHAHERIAVEFTYWAPGFPRDTPEKKALVEAFEARLSETLGPLLTPEEYDRRPPVEPAWYQGHWGIRHLAVVFRDLVEGVAAFTRVAEEMRVDWKLDLRECPSDVKDPFALVRGAIIPWGPARLIVWGIGDPSAAMKALREVMGGSIDEVKALLESLPFEILVDVEIAYANQAREKLVRAGCDAEVVVPAKRGG